MLHNWSVVQVFSVQAEEKSHTGPFRKQTSHLFQKYKISQRPSGSKIKPEKLFTERKNLDTSEQLEDTFRSLTTILTGRLYFERVSGFFLLNQSYEGKK